MTGPASNSDTPAPGQDAQREGRNEPRGSEVRLDVRPLLAGGQEAFGVIMDAVSHVAPGGIFVLDAPFDPTPLRRVLAKKGFTYELKWFAEDHCRVTFKRQDTEPPAAAQPIATGQPGAKIWREADGTHIDVRGLSPPNPMMAILRLIEQPDCGPVVVVHHDREPIFLFPELTERGWHYETISTNGEEVRIRLARGQP